VRVPDPHLELLGFALLFTVGFLASFPFALRAALRQHLRETR
jgi:hypothetical protein